LSKPTADALRALAERRPNARANPKLADAALTTYQTLLREHVERMYSDAATGKKSGQRWKNWQDFSRPGLGKLWSEMRMDPEMHYNAQNGLLSFHVTMTNVSGSERS
jgi:hypothetical protein